MGGGPSKECPPGKTVYTPGPPGKTVYTPSAYLGIGYNAVDNNSKQMLTALQKVFAQTQINVCNEASQKLINEIAKEHLKLNEGTNKTNDIINKFILKINNMFINDLSNNIVNHIITKISLNDKGALKQSLIDLFTLIINLSSIQDSSGVKYLNNDKFIQNLKNLLYTICPNAVSLKPIINTVQSLPNNNPINNPINTTLNSLPNNNTINTIANQNNNIISNTVTVAKTITLKNSSSGTISYEIFTNTGSKSGSGSIGNNGSASLTVPDTNEISIKDSNNISYVYPKNYANGTVLEYKNGKVTVIPSNYTSTKVVKSLPVVGSQAPLKLPAYFDLKGLFKFNVQNNFPVLEWIDIPIPVGTTIKNIKVNFIGHKSNVWIAMDKNYTNPLKITSTTTSPLPSPGPNKNYDKEYNQSVNYNANPKLVTKNGFISILFVKLTDLGTPVTLRSADITLS